MAKRLARIPEGAGKLVVLEGVYSMLGDVAPLKEMVAVAKKHGCMVLVDEAHSMGFIGEHGRGVRRHILPEAGRQIRDQQTADLLAVVHVVRQRDGAQQAARWRQQCGEIAGGLGGSGAERRQ